METVAWTKTGVMRGVTVIDVPLPSSQSGEAIRMECVSNSPAAWSLPEGWTAMSWNYSDGEATFQRVRVDGDPLRVSVVRSSGSQSAEVYAEIETEESAENSRRRSLARRGYWFR